MGKQCAASPLHVLCLPLAGEPDVIDFLCRVVRRQWKDSMGEDAAQGCGTCMSLTAIHARFGEVCLLAISYESTSQWTRPASTIAIRFWTS